jgi:hypothetical protein
MIVVPSPLNRMPCITAFGTRFPPRFAYPSRVHRYKPFSLPTLQTCAPVAARAVADVPSDIAAARHADAQAKAKELIMIFVNFVFMKDSGMRVARFLIKAATLVRRDG